MKRKTIIALEMGTSKTVAIAGEVTEASVRFLGSYELPSKGIQHGRVVDLEGASQVVRQVIQELKKKLSIAVKSIYLVYQDDSMHGFQNCAEVELASTCVTEGSIQFLNQIAQEKVLTEQHVFLTHHLNGFSIDGETVICPLGREGDRLGADYYSVVVNRQPMMQMILILNAHGITLEGCIPSGLAESLVVTADRDRQRGCLIIDVGASTTHYTLYQNACLMAIGSLPLGGNQLTADLGFALGISWEEAEILKKRFGGCFLNVCQDQHLMSKEFEHWSKIKKHTVVEILQCRMEEILDMIKKNLPFAVDYAHLPGGIILTGGGAHVMGIECLTSQMFKNNAYCRELFAQVPIEFKQPEYAAIVGGLFYARASKNL